MTGQRDATQRLAGQVRQALGAADLAAYADLLDPAVRWGPPGDPSPPCQNRNQVLAWYQRGRDAGTRARVTETLVSGDRILVGLKVTGQAADAGEKDRWQVLTVRRGRVTSITGFDDRDEAAACAGLAAAPARQPQTTRWAAPRHRLADDQIELRLPDPADAAVLHAYAAQPGGLDGTWARSPRTPASPTARRWLTTGWPAGATSAASTAVRSSSSPRAGRR